jgi:methylase of polypeptide subunit release factors
MANMADPRTTSASRLSEPEWFDLPCFGRCFLPREFRVFTGEIHALEVHDAREDPDDLLSRLAAGLSLVLTGTYRHVDAAYRYCQHYQERLSRQSDVAHVTDRVSRLATLTAIRRRKLHHLLVIARNESLVGVTDFPKLNGLRAWLETPTGDAQFLIPFRRLQRILTDMRRAREGMRIAALGATITILPHVYVPADQSVPAMFTRYQHLFHGKRVLDMGTGTGVLALLAARFGAAEVVATDINPHAVENARLNVERLGFDRVVRVCGPADLFDAVSGQVFDVIVFNAPWIKGEPRTLYDTGLYDPGCRILDGFLQGAPAHLAPGGVILLQYSNVSNAQRDDSLAHLYGQVTANGLMVVSRSCISRVSRVLGGRETVCVFEIRSANAPCPAARAPRRDRTQDSIE